ncbi:unnamed protein product, partial [Meganyctiphanes norvegica]
MGENECIVCFSHYDDGDRRPRFMPCGHTLCSKCLEKAIKKVAKICPTCRKPYSASNVNDLPVNFSLERIVTSTNVAEKVPECPEHELPVSHRCSSHKAWVCNSCLSKDHSPKSCKIITIDEELSFKKATQLSQAQPLLNALEETCHKTDDTKKQCKQIIEETDKEIIRLETMVKILQEEIQRKKTFKNQIDVKYAMFDKKLENIKYKRCTYDEAVTSLMSSDTIREVSTCLVEVEHQAKRLKLISNEIEREENLMLQAFNIPAESTTGLSLGNHKLSVQDGRHHLHVFQGKVNPIDSKKGPKSLQFTDENDPPSTDGILTFMDFAWPKQRPRRVYMKMIGNTVRARQHMLLLTGQCGSSYRGLTFSTVFKRGQRGEYILIQPHDGKKAAPLFKDVTVTDDIPHMLSAGLVYGAGQGADRGNNALFAVKLIVDHGSSTAGFARVTEGLDILQDIAKSDKINEIKCVDCGIVLFY